MHIIRKAVEQDLFQVRKLIKEAGLHDQGVEEHLEHFFVVEDRSESEDPPRLVGAVGMEVHEPYGLLRSFVLKRASWNKKVGVRMIEILLNHAANIRLKSVYLLAGDASPFFTQFGFEAVKKEDLPPPILKSDHVRRTVHQGIPMVFSCSEKLS